MNVSALKKVVSAVNAIVSATAPRPEAVGAMMEGARKTFMRALGDHERPHCRRAHHVDAHSSLFVCCGQSRWTFAEKHA